MMGSGGHGHRPVAGGTTGDWLGVWDGRSNDEEYGHPHAGYPGREHGLSIVQDLELVNVAESMGKPSDEGEQGISGVKRRHSGPQLDPSSSLPPTAAGLLAFADFPFASALCKESLGEVHPFLQIEQAVLRVPHFLD